MTVTEQDMNELKAIYRGNTPAQLNAALVDIDNLTARFPKAMPEFFEVARRLCLDECERRNRARELWQTGQTGYVPRGYQESQ